MREDDLVNKEPRRWDTDERRHGIASGAPLLPHVQRLAEHLRRDGWIAEQPEAHLLPHLRDGSAFQITGEHLRDDGVYEVALDLVSDAKGVNVLREAIRLLSAIAEPGFFVRQVDENTIDCATGVFDGDPPGFASHGHLIRLIINRPGR
jgi:hypothetical protein